MLRKRFQILVEFRNLFFVTFESKLFGFFFYLYPNSSCIKCGINIKTHNTLFLWCSSKASSASVLFLELFTILFSGDGLEATAFSGRGDRDTASEAFLIGTAPAEDLQAFLNIN